MNERTIVNTKLRMIVGDITKQQVDAVVTAANSALRGGGGVDGAVHRVAGPQLLRECRHIGRCPTGSAVITEAGNLNASYVIHAVGPIYRGGNRGEPALLAGAYRRSLELAIVKKLRSIAFPAISTGAYGYPLEQAADIAVQTVADCLAGYSGGITEVRFVLFNDQVYQTFCQSLKKLQIPP